MAEAAETTQILPGFMGAAKIGDDTTRLTDFSMNSTQNAEFFDHVIGLNDTVPTGNSTKGEEVGTVQTQKRMWRPGTIDISGGISFSALETAGTSNITALFDAAKRGTYFDMEYQYYCAGEGESPGRKFTDCRVNTFNLSVVAGDIVNISAEIKAKKMEDSSVKLSLKDAQKMVTWDKVTVKSDAIDGLVQGFDLSINNNILSIYSEDPVASGGDKPFSVRDLRIGMQEVTGSVKIYLKDGESFLSVATALSKMTLTVGSFSTPIEVVFLPIKINGITGPIITDIPFIGVDKPFAAAQGGGEGE